MPDDLIANAKRNRAALLKRNAVLARQIFDAMNLVKAKVEKQTTSLLSEIAELKKNGQPISPTLLFERGRLKNLLAEIDFEINKSALSLGIITQNAQKASIIRAISEANLINKSSDTLSGAITGFDRAALEKLVGYGANDAKTPLAAMYKRIGEPFAAKVQSVLIVGLGTGANNSQIASEIRKAFDTTSIHAQTIARTETNNAYREASREIYHQNKDRIKGYIWISALDLRTCSICWSLHGRIFKTNKKFLNHPNCLVEGTQVSSTQNKAATRRFYEGEVIEIETSNGFKLTVTPNHPILTTRGFIAAQFLNESDYCVSTFDSQRVSAAVNPHNDNVPADCAEIFDFLSVGKRLPSAFVPAAAENFHSDGRGGDVEIILTDSLLQNNFNASFNQPISQDSLIFGDMELLDLASLSAFDKFGFRHNSTSNGIVRGAGISGVFGSCPFGHHQSVSFGLTANRNAAFNQTSSDNLAGNIETISDRFFGFARQVSPLDVFDRQVDFSAFDSNTVLFQKPIEVSAGDSGFVSDFIENHSGNVIIDRIVKITHKEYKGNVYNFETLTGYYIANGIVTHNCRCTIIPYNGKQTIKTGESEFAQLTDAQKIAIVGAKRFELHKSGARLENFVGSKKTEYGESPVLIPLDEIKFKKGGKRKTERAKILTALDTPQPKKEPKDIFPTTIAELETVKSLGGSTGAKLVKDKAGKLFVLKEGASEAHLREEFLADSVYRKIGVNVPEARLITEKGKLYKVAEFVEGDSLKSILNDKVRSDIVFAELQKDFAADVLLSNRDVVGLDFDNILIGKDGRVWRIDNGASFRFRAQGGAKDYDEHLSDVWTLRDGAVNPQTAKVFDSLDFYQVGKQFKSLAVKESEIIAILPDELKPIVAKRFGQMRDLVEYSDDLQKSKWKAAFADDVAKNVVGLRRENISQIFPKKLQSKTTDITRVVDENGKLFDSLRGSNSIVGKLEKYMSANGGAIRIVEKWQAAQAGSSWSKESRRFKYFLSESLDVSKDSFYWHFDDTIKTEGFEAGKLHYEQMKSNYGGDSVYRASMAQYKAFVMEFLRGCDFLNNDRTKRKLKVIRTETDIVIKSNGVGLKRYAKSIKNFKRGAAESYSIFKKTTVKGNEITVQNVNYADVHGVYFFGKRDGKSVSEGAFLSDNENEIVALWLGDDSEVDYIADSELKNYGFTK